MASAIMGIDVGTSAIKAAVLRPDGTRLATASEHVATRRPRPSWSEQDMDDVWDAVSACTRRCLEASGLEPAQLAAVGCCGQGDGAWMLDGQGRPVGPAILWNDNRAAAIVKRWEASQVLEEVYRRTGTVLWPGSMAGIVAWLAEHAPEAVRAIRTVFCCKDWVNYRLTGTIATDRTDGSIPFTNMRERAGDPLVMEALGLSFLRGALPEPRDSADLVGRVGPEAARVTGLAEGTPVVTGLLDVAANAVGAGVVAPGQAMLCLGTTSLFCAVLDQPPQDRQMTGATTLAAVPGQWLRVFGSQSGTPNLDWVARVLGEGRGEGAAPLSFEQLEAQAAGSPVGCGGVLYHPYLQGERAPFLEPDATSAFFGITSRTTARDLARSVYEGVALSTRHCLTATDLRVSRLVLTGGGARSALWSQMVSDATGCECSMPEGEELGVLGAAIVAGVGVGLYRSYREAADRLCREQRRYRPIPEHALRYAELYALFEELVGLMGEFWKKRAAWTRRWEGPA